MPLKFALSFAPSTEAAQAVGTTPFTAPSGAGVPVTVGAPFPVLLALAQDGTAGAAIRVTQALAKLRGAAPTALTVEELGAYPLPEALPGALTAELLSPEFQAERRIALERQVTEVLGATPPWNFAMDVGEPVSCICDHVRRTGAQLAVLGLRSHGVLRRVFIRDTVRQVVANAQVPVLAVRPTLAGLPRRAIVAMDFGPASVRAAHMARRLIDDTGSIHLVYVHGGPEMYGPKATTGMRVLHELGVDAAFARLLRELDAPPSMAISTGIYRGAPTPHLIATAERLEPDLIALGSEHATAFDRLMGESVSAQFEHSARWSLLVAPEPPDDGRA